MRILLGLALLAAVGVVIWLYGIRVLSGALDRLSTNRTAVRPLDQLRYDNGVLEMAGVRLDLMVPGSLPSGFNVALSGTGRVTFTYADGEFPCGPGRKQGGPDTLPDVTFKPDAGDQVTLTTEQSRVSWPTPLEMNFMTGSAPSWRRHLYYRLTWLKRSGARLEILWRYQQGFFAADGWRPATVEYGSAGFLRASIVPAEDLRKAATEYLVRVKHWQEADYRLESQGPDSGGSAEVMAAIHRDDERGAQPGAGRSVKLLLDYKTRAVVREIAFQ
ncbi:hypothetical protein [Paludibaculum fermentans]|uniref:Uncharacterized protein n=1 Tax=Paludibaculum fermentans TaxID=1473598 RepID=A0A7S7NL09_PALFE|nr:hypothetical protein [Paludibaculum fermentans]QOY85504.1 hypothetical protein IRI77_22045 [Paludibaculum fermentans]